MVVEKKIHRNLIVWGGTAISVISIPLIVIGINDKYKIVKNEDLLIGLSLIGGLVAGGINGSYLNKKVKIKD